MRLHEAFRPRDDHAADGLGAGNVAVVVDLDAARRLFETEDLSHAFEELALRGAFREAAAKRLARIGQRVVDEFPLLATARHADGDLAAGANGEGFGEQAAARHVMAEKDHAGRGTILIELGEEGIEHLIERQFLVMAGEIGAVAPVLSGAEEEDLHAGLAAFRPGREDIRLRHSLRVDALMGLDLREGADAVAIDRGALEIEIGGSLVHEADELLLRLAAAALEEGAGLFHEFGVALFAYLARAGRAAALDLEEETGARAAFEDAIGAGAQQKGLLKRVERRRDGARAGEGAEVIALRRTGAAMLQNLRKGVVAPEQDVGERLVVPHQHVVAGLQALDEVRFEEEGVRLRGGGDELHLRRGGDHAGDAVRVTAEFRITRDALLEASGLADIEKLALRIVHAVDARAVGEKLHLFGDERRSRGAGGGPLSAGIGPVAVCLVGLVHVACITPLADSRFPRSGRRRAGAEAFARPVDKFVERVGVPAGRRPSTSCNN